MQFSDEFFGNEAQKTVSRRARDIWRICGGDHRFAYNGRITALAGDIGPDTAPILTSLSRLQGSTTGHFLSKSRVEAIQQALQAEGLSTNIWEFCQGRETAHDAARAVLKAYTLPEDIRVERLGVDTPAPLVSEFAAMAADCGVLAMCGRVIRGLDIPGVTLAGIDDKGERGGQCLGLQMLPFGQGLRRFCLLGRAVLP